MNAVVLTGAVMAHPRRLAAAKEIATLDAQGRIKVVTDPDPSGPPTALRTANPSWSCVGNTATHHIVFQDDVILAEGFFPYAEQTAAAFPREAVAFYEGWEGRNSGVVRLGALTGASWAYALDEHVPSLALMLPAEVARGYEEFATEHGDGWPYDVVVQRYLKALKVPVRLAVPSTVDHDDVPSLAGNSKHGWRRATYFTDKAEHSNADASSFPVVPFYQYGESKCAVRYAEDWEYLPTETFLHRVRLTEPCDTAFAEAGQPELPDAVRRQVWLTAFATGVVCAGLTAGPVDTDVVKAVMDSLGPGGLCEDYTGAELLEMMPNLRELAIEAFASGEVARRAASQYRLPLTAPYGPEAEPVFVTGGSPAFGRQLARLLADAGYGTTYSKGLQVSQTQAAPGALIHVGGYGGGSSDVLEMLGTAEKMGVQRVVLLSSTAVYQGAESGTEEAVTARPVDDEAAAWWDEEQTFLRWGKKTSTPVQVIRLAEQVGPHAPLKGVLASWMLQAWTRRPMVLTPGRTHQIIDHCDIAGALAHVLANPPRSSIYNVASTTYDENELAHLAATTARRTPWEEKRAADDTARTPRVSTQLISAETGWQPSAPVRSGARALAQWLACDIHAPGPASPLWSSGV